MAFAVYGLAVVLAPAIGPTRSAFITDHYHLAVGVTSSRSGGIASVLSSHPDPLVESPSPGEVTKPSCPRRHSAWG